MKVIVAGSRDETDFRKVAAAIKASGFNITQLLSGGCRGVDAIAEAWAKMNRIPVVRIPADWARWGKAAGPIRNQLLVDRGDALIAIPGPKSVGTYDIIERATEKGILNFVYKEDK